MQTLDLSALATPETKIKNAFSECILSLVFSLPWAVAFGKLTEDSSRYYPCTTVSSSYQWAYVTYIFYVFTCCVQLFACLLLIIAIKAEKAICTALFGCLVILIRSGLGVTCITLFGGLCYSLGENENCGDLNTLIEVFIIIFSVGLGMGCIIACCMFCCGAVISEMKQSTKQQIVSDKNDNALNEKNSASAKEIINIQPNDGLANGNQA